MGSFLHQSRFVAAAVEATVHLDLEGLYLPAASSPQSL